MMLLQKTKKPPGINRAAFCGVAGLGGEQQGFVQGALLDLGPRAKPG